MPHSATLKDCWAIALDINAGEIQDHNNFFELGGDSVQAIRLAEVARENNLDVDVETIFSNPTFQKMLANIKIRDTDSPPNASKPWPGINLSLVKACAETCDVSPETIEDVFPTVGIQDFLMLGHLRSGAYMLQVVFELEGTQDPLPVCNAFDAIRAYNEVLRTRIVSIENQKLQVVVKDPVAWRTATNLTDYITKDRNERMVYWQPLVRYATVREPNKTYIVWTCHHSVFDGWMRRLIFDDLQSYLKDPAAFDAKPARLPFKQFVEYQSSLNAEEAKNFWTDYLGSFQPAKTLYTTPSDYNPYVNQTVTKKDSFARPTKSVLTVSNMAQAAFASALCQMTGSHDIILSVVRGSRAIPMPGAESIMGSMLSTVPLRIQLPPQKPVSEVIYDLQNTSTTMLRYETFGPEYLYQERLKDSLIFNWFPPGSDSLVRVAEFDVAGKKASLRVAREMYPPHAIVCMINAYDNGDHLRITSEYDDRVLGTPLLEKLLGLFTRN